MTDAYRQIIDTLARCKRVLVTTHVRPDGDALGSTAAMVMGLKKKGIDAEVLLLSHLPRKYAFIYQEYAIPFIDVERGFPPAFSLDPYDALLVIDTGTWSQLPGLEPYVARYAKPKLVIDHHLTQQDWADIKLVVTQAAAAGEIVFEVLEQWDIGLDAPMATALFLAICTDTGWFQFSNTRPFTMHLAAELMEAGVDTDRMYQLLYQNERAERVLLQTRAVQSLQLLAGGKLAVMTVTRRDFEETRAGVPDTENLINIPLQIRTVEVSLLFTEPLDAGPVRVSLRSKGQVDVAQFAERFGGGGHARAAGLKVDGQFGDVLDQVVTAMVQRLTEQAVAS
jgi:phosphoesterase RecJ-like protein